MTNLFDLVNYSYTVVKMLWVFARGRLSGWWIAVDSNHRPLAYQASALTY